MTKVHRPITSLSESTIKFLTVGRLWVLKCLAATLVLTVMLTCSPILLSRSEVKLPPAYQLKSIQPFADTVPLTIPEHAGERSHGAKLTPRIFGAILLYSATKMSFHPYLPATLGGIALLASGILLGYQISNDRLVGLFLGMTLGGLYASSTCFAINWMPKPFDGVVLGLIGLAMVSYKRPGLLFIFSFLSCWTDERSLVSLVFIAFLTFSLPHLSNREKYVRYGVLASAALAYGVTRFTLAAAMQWESPDLSLTGIDILKENILYLPLAAWICFEGGWGIIIIAGWVLFAKQNHLHLLLLFSLTGAAIAFCLIVFDASRASSFGLPIIPASLAVLVGKEATKQHLRILAGTSAITSLLAPNFEMITGVLFKWLPSLPFEYLASFE